MEGDDGPLKLPVGTALRVRWADGWHVGAIADHRVELGFKGKSLLRTQIRYEVRAGSGRDRADFFSFPSHFAPTAFAGRRDAVA